jgi:hypothetical protein
LRGVCGVTQQSAVLGCKEIQFKDPMHLAYTSEFSGGQQTAGWLAEKATAHKTKFETDQENKLVMTW